MRKCAIAFLRNVKPNLHTDAFRKRALYSLASSPDAAEVGACPASKISMGTLETRKATVRKARELKAATIGCVTLHEDISSSAAGKGRPTIAKSKRKAKPGGASEMEVLKAVDASVLAEDSATQNSEAEEPASHAKFECGEIKAVQNAAIDRSEKTEFKSNKSMINAKKDTELNGMINGKEEFDLSANVSMINENEGMINATENIIAAIDGNMINAKQELAEWDAKFDIRTSRPWMEIANKLLDYGISSSHVKKMLTKCRTASPTHCVDSTMKHFTMLGMSPEDIGCVISRLPTILQMSDNMFRSKVEFFESLGIDKRSLGRIMNKAYRSLALSPSTLRERSEFWKDYLEGVQENAIRTLILRNPLVLSSNLQTVKQTLAYLEELGFSKVIFLRAPSILTCSVNALAMRLKALDQLGLSNSIRSLVGLHGIGELKLHGRLHNLLALGFSFEQVKEITMKYPLLLRINEENISLKLSYAVNVMKLSLDMLLLCPAFWGYSYEKRIKYRYEVLQDLKSHGAYTKTISLGYLLVMSNAKFSKNFVEKLHVYTNHPSE